MALIRWSPFREVMTFRDEMDKLLGDLYGKTVVSRDQYDGDWLPAMDIAENDSEVTASLELPGLKREDIKVSVQDDVLTVTGEKKQEQTEDAGRVHKVERSYGYFKRVVSLPTSVDAGKVKATYKDGLLTISLPKTESKKPKEIAIEVS
jgi:HSP20 family protein